MSGGLFVFAPYKRLYEKQTTLGRSGQDGLGDDIFFELLPYTDQEVEDEQWGVVRGTDNIPSLWDVKLKQLDWNKRLRDALETRM